MPGYYRRTDGNRAMVRGDIEKGKSGDKKPGFDPAAAPLETDEEAGATAPAPTEVAGGQRKQMHPDPGDHQGTTADAMRPFAPGRIRKIKSSGRVMLAIMLATLAIGFVFASWGQ